MGDSTIHQKRSGYNIHFSAATLTQPLYGPARGTLCHTLYHSQLTKGFSCKLMGSAVCGALPLQAATAFGAAIYQPAFQNIAFRSTIAAAEPFIFPFPLAVFYFYGIVKHGPAAETPPCKTLSTHNRY